MQCNGDLDRWYQSDFSLRLKSSSAVNLDIRSLIFIFEKSLCQTFEEIIIDLRYQ